MVMEYTQTMVSKKEPTQKTPQGEEIPIPTRGEFMRDLKKVAKVGKKSQTTRRPKKK